jgi:heme-degrading monooxygenase HmoA
MKPMDSHYAVIFTSIRTEKDAEGYASMADRMVELAEQQPGFLGIDSASDADGTNITVSYWQDEASIEQWRMHAEHLEAQRLGKEVWYEQFNLRVAKVERVYSFDGDKKIRRTETS